MAANDNLIKQIEFICGCVHIINTADIEDVGWWKEVSTDRQGYLICVAHGVRRKEWASMPEGAAAHLADWKYASFTPLEIEQFEIFGKPLPLKLISLKEEAVEDVRDNRDPEEVGCEVLAAAAARGNGFIKQDLERDTMRPETRYCDEATDSGHSSANGLN